ncbi:MAG TPA: HIT family protein [Lachnospiraceae bacterium]|nr:HIT family protein [Lachnospiraceae bacterium]
MKDDNCIFCKLANGEFPSKSIYEDLKFKVILDLSPATKGHALILPKDHYENIYDLPDELAADMIQLAKKMTITMTDKLHCEGFNLVQNNGIIAGQTVFHFHMHLIPRYKDDNQDISWVSKETTDDELEKTRQEIMK